MKLLSVVTPSSIYHGCSTKKTFWEEKFTLGEFTSVNIKNCGRHNVRKHMVVVPAPDGILISIFMC